MRFIAILVVLLFMNENAWSWGQNGHRAIGHIAERYLSNKAKKKLRTVLNNQHLSYVSTWMDDIKSDEAWDHAYDWHWVTIPEGQTYDVAEKNSNGDIIATIERLILELETGGLSTEKEAQNIKMLIHLIGDIHQPLHVGTGEDQGGNKVKVKWFWDDSNLHRVWDSEMIQSKELSFTELAHSTLYLAQKDAVERWQNSTVIDWALESMAMRETIYNLPEDKSIGYDYMYQNWNHVERRLLQAGVRLASVLNKIYG